MGSKRLSLQMNSHLSRNYFSQDQDQRLSIHQNKVRNLKMNKVIIIRRIRWYGLGVEIGGLSNSTEHQKENQEENF